MLSLTGVAEDLCIDDYTGTPAVSGYLSANVNVILAMGTCIWILILSQLASVGAQWRIQSADKVAKERPSAAVYLNACGQTGKKSACQKGRTEERSGSTSECASFLLTTAL